MLTDRILNFLFHYNSFCAFSKLVWCFWCKVCHAGIIRIELVSLVSLSMVKYQICFKKQHNVYIFWHTCVFSRKTIKSWNFLIESVSFLTHFFQLIQLRQSNTTIFRLWILKLLSLWIKLAPKKFPTWNFIKWSIYNQHQCELTPISFNTGLTRLGS